MRHGKLLVTRMIAHSRTVRAVLSIAYRMVPHLVAVAGCL
jgi:hypothetical protein